MAELKFEGTGVAIITPFRDDKSVDFKSLGKLLEYVISNHVDFVVVLGTTGEAVTLSKDEKQAVVEFVVDETNGRVPIVLGKGGYNTQEIVDSLSSSKFNGIDGILSVAPYYNKPSQEGLYQHFKAIAAASPLPVIIYNVPGRTCSNICAETTIRLAREVHNIVAVKEASGNLPQIMHVLNNKPDDFLVLSGDDVMTLPMMMMGGSGAISVIANAYPKQFSDMVNFALGEKFDKAQDIHYDLLNIICAIFQEGSPGGIKALLNILGIASNNLRLPLIPVSNQLYDKLQKLNKELR